MAEFRHADSTEWPPDEVAGGGYRRLRGCARVLLDDHLRVGEAGRADGRASVRALPRPDVIGVYVLLPKVD